MGEILTSKRWSAVNYRIMELLAFSVVKHVLVCKDK